jgi:catechol 2,3-dioxygenase-like lactoylglutathione lyase family enzyme
VAQECHTILGPPSGGAFHSTKVCALWQHKRLLSEDIEPERESKSGKPGDSRLTAGTVHVMPISGIDHIQVAAPPQREQAAREFYGALLGLAELEKPPALETRGGVWFALPDGRQLHIGVVSAEEFVPASKAHPGFAVPVAELDGLGARLDAAGVNTAWDEGVTIPGVRRFHAHDPFGNRLEFVGI